MKCPYLDLSLFLALKCVLDRRSAAYSPVHANARAWVIDTSTLSKFPSESLKSLTRTTKATSELLSSFPSYHIDPSFMKAGWQRVFRQLGHWQHFTRLEYIFEKHIVQMEAPCSNPGAYRSSKAEPRWPPQHLAIHDAGAQMAS